MEREDDSDLNREDGTPSCLETSVPERERQDSSSLRDSGVTDDAVSQGISISQEPMPTILGRIASDVNVLEPYRYAPLPWESKPDTIRLIELFPGSGDEHIVCIILETALGDNREYEALSYCWGNPNVHESIIVQEPTGASRLAVTTNLFTALHQLRDPKYSTYLWADAICINQTDDEEKSHQILLMRRIYEGAKETLVWLGPEDKDTWKGCALIHKLVSAQEAQNAKNDTRFYYQMGVKGQTEYGLPDPFSSWYKAFSALLDREWFTRVWIIQEVAVSKRVSIICGSYQTSWDDFMKAVDYATTIVIPGINANTTNFQRLFQLVVAKVSIERKYEQSLLSLVTLYRNFNATNKRDKIYALLGVAQKFGADALRIYPDYKIELSEVYRNFAVSVLEQRKSLDILSVPRVSKVSEVDKLGQLPSWVPDWSISDFAVSLRFETHSRQYSYDFAATPKYCELKPQFRENNSVLILEGHVVDEIEEAGEVHTHQVEDQLTFLQRIGRISAEQSVLNGWERVCKARSGGKYQRTGEDILDAYWQTLCVGQKPQGFDAAKKDFSMWDICARKPMRFVPTSQYLSWTHKILSLPVLATTGIATGIAMLTSEKPIEKIMNFRSKMTVATQRRMIRTKEGLIGLAPELAQRGDFVCLLRGGRVPLVMRKVDSRWMLIGDTYVHGIMQGEAFEDAKCKAMWIQ